MWGKKSERSALTVDAIQERLAAESQAAARAEIAREDEQTGRDIIDSHFAPQQRLTLLQAREVLQVHLACDRQTCPKKMAAWNIRVAAGEIVPDRRVSY